MIRTFAVSAVAVALSLALATTTSAQWSEDFEGPGSKQSWSINGLTATFGYAPLTSNLDDSVTGGIGNGDQRLHVYSANDAANNGAAIALGIVNSPDPFEDGVIGGLVAADPSRGGDADIGVLARANPISTSGYLLTMGFGRNGIASLQRSDTGTLVWLGDIVVPTLEWDATEDYYLELAAYGDQLTASIYDEVDGALLGSITRTDATYSAGAGGFLVSANTGTGASGHTAAYIDDVTFVPEPGSLTLLVGAMGLLLTRRRRR